MGAMLERDAVVTAVAETLESAAQGRGQALLVTGAAGLGKTTILEHAAAMAGDRFRTGIGRADIAEAALPFGLVSQALEPLVGQVELGDPSGPGALPSPGQYFYAALGRLREAAHNPLMLAFDDAQWADPDSLTLLRLICRRVEAIPVAVLVTTRPWPPEAVRAGEELAAQGLARVERLEPLSRGAAEEVLAHRVDEASIDDLELVVELCGGNPLLLEYVATTLRHGGGLPEREAAGGASWARRLILSHTAGLSGEAQEFLRAAAVLGRRFRPEVAAEMAGLTSKEAALAQEALELADLGRDMRDGWAEFNHELIRQAVYELAAPARVRLHETAFRVLWSRGVHPSEAADHALAGRLVGDPAALDAVVWTGREALGVGAVAAARRYLQAGVDLAGREPAADVVYDLGRAMMAQGDHVDAMELYEELLGRDSLPKELCLATLSQLSRTRVTSSQFAQADIWLDEELRLAGPEDAELIAAALVDRAVQTTFNTGTRPGMSMAEAARKMAPESSVAIRSTADAAWAVGAYLSGDPSGLTVAERAARSGRAVASRVPLGEPSWDPVLAHAMLALSAEQFREAEQLLASLLDSAERRLDPWSLSRPLFFLGSTYVRLGRLHEALALSDRLVEAAELVPVSRPLAAMHKATVLMEIGDLDEAAAWCVRLADLETKGEGFRISTLMGLHPRATVALRQGHLKEACDHFSAIRQMAAALGVNDPCFTPWARDAITAFLAYRRESAAREIIDLVESGAMNLPATWPKVVAAVGRAALAEHHGALESADHHLVEAIGLHDTMTMPLSRSETLTAYGSFLCRHGDPRRARPLLAEARQIAEDCGAAWHAERARTEWRRAGGRSGTTPVGELTPQERAVARLAKAGRTNREIASQLYLSTNTVQTHLVHVFQKLGITRRRQLHTWSDEGRNERR